MRLLRFALLALLSASPIAAQVSCAAGGAVTTEALNTGPTCTVFTGTVGTDILKTSQTSALGSQTICDTSSTCPAGLVTVLINITPVATGTLVSSVTPTITFTDPVGTKTNLALTNTAGVAALSLVTSTPGSYIFFFYHAANTAITVSTTTTTLTGSPSYNFYSRLLW